MTRSFHYFIFASFLVAAGLPARRAHAASPKADALVNQAVDLRRDGDDQGALALLLQAYGMGRAPRATGQLGLCEQALGRWADAEVYITEALKSETDPWVKKNRRTLEDALAIVKSHIARLEVEGEPEGAEVWVNGVLAGKLPVSTPIRVSAGEIEIELRAPGYVRETRTVRLEAGQYQRIVLRASKPVATPAPVAAAPPPPSSPTTVVVKVEDQRRPEQPEEPTPPASAGRLSLKWVAWGLGAVGIGLGIYGAAKNSSGVSAFNTAGCGIDAMGRAVDKTGMLSPTCASEKSSYENSAHLGIAGFIAGGVFAATGFILWATEPAARVHDTALTCVPTVSAQLTPALGCSLRF